MSRLYGKDLHSEIERLVDPGIRYSVRTPQGIKYTVIRPAAAHGSSEFIDYVTHQYESRKSNRKRR